MISTTLGAPSGGVTRGGHQGFDWLAFRSIIPPVGSGDGGSCLPSIIMVALGDPGTALICCAYTMVCGSGTPVTQDTSSAAQPSNRQRFILRPLWRLGCKVLNRPNAVSPRT